MCGIFAVFNLKGIYYEQRQLVQKLLKRIRHRGPDSTGIQHYEVSTNCHHFICHEVLAIVDPNFSHQPQFDNEKLFCTATNGEIYNHPELFKALKGNYDYKGKSDCQVISYMFKELEVKEIANLLSGKFGFITYDTKKNKFYVVRDHIGIIPVYLGRGFNGEFYVSNELKALHDVASTIEVLLPGHYYDSELKQQIRWYNPVHYNMELIPEGVVDLGRIRDKLILAVKRRLMCDVPLGVLLSGGLDSSLIASITVRFYEEFKKEHAEEEFVHSKVDSFCIGLEGSPDLKASRETAQFLGTNHHELTFTVEEGLDAISDVIYHTETFNPTTIRASTPMYLLARKIKSFGIKMVLTGEGSDEIFGGYLYFHKAPNKKEFHHETIRKLQDLYKYDLLRANKCMLAWGVEPRVPFMDKDFVEYAMSIDPQNKMINEEHRNIEKWVLRKAFEDKKNPFLPDHILWRQKEQFSDGVGYNWIDSLKVFYFLILKKLVESVVSDDDLKHAHINFPIKTPPSKEAYYYRLIFEKHFPSMSAVTTVPQAKSIACSTEKAIEWDESFKKNADESGRAVLGVHTTKGSELEIKLFERKNSLAN